MTNHRTILAAALLVASNAFAGGATPGDDCHNALPAVVGTNGPVSTATMTPSADPPANEDCAFLNWSNSRDAWWRFDAPFAGSLSLEFCDSNFDTSIVVYQGSCGSLERIACDDDSCAPTGPLYQSAITALPVEAGPVYVRVGGYGGGTGQVAFRLGFKPAGGVRVWGDNLWGQTNVPADLGASIAVSSDTFPVAVRADGIVRTWAGGLGVTPPADLGPVKDVAAGYGHVLAITSSRQVRAWGNNGYGQALVPADVGSAIAVAAGREHSVAIRANGTVRAWGNNYQNAANVPADLGTAIAVDAAQTSNLAIRSDGTVRGWGYNGSGQISIPADLGVTTAVALGGFHSLAITASGNVRAWGDNFYGQSTVPADLGIATAVACGRTHSVALLASGAVRAWGNNEDGQLNVPSTLGRVSAIAAGEAFTMAITTRDCEGDGIADVLQVAENDCDADGTHDCWQAEVGSLEDCNGNGLGDSCEKSLQVVANSGQLGPIGAAHNQVFVIANCAPALEPDRVTVRVRARGDFSSGLEFLRVRIGTAFDVQALGGTVDCGAGTPTQAFTMSAADFNASIDPDGAVRVRLEPSIAVDWNICPEGTWAEVEVEYLGAQPADCNQNGVLDSCELADGLSPDTNNNGIVDGCEAPFVPCSPDFNGDGTVNGADLGVLLGTWGPVTPGIPVDLTGDGLVNGADLGILLGSWGSCAD